MKTLAVAVQKGGTGKSTISAHLAAGLAAYKIRVLSVDIDHQGDCTYLMLGDPQDFEPSMSVLFEDKQYKSGDLIHHTRFEGVDAIPANLSLSVKERRTITGSETRLRDYLRLVSPMYDIAIVDCPPSLTLFTVNALMAADHVLCPIVPEKFAVKGVRDFMQTLTDIRESNPNLNFLGVIPSIVDMRYSVHKNILADLKESLGDFLLNQYMISSNAAIKKAANVRQTVYEYDKRARTYKQFLKLSKYVKRVVLDEKK